MISGANPLCLGFDVAGKDPAAGRIGYQTYSGNSLDIVGAGSNGQTRKVYVYDFLGVGFTPYYNLDINGTARIYNGANARLNIMSGGGGSAQLAGIDMFSYANQGNGPGSSIYCQDDGNYGSHMLFYTHNSGAAGTSNEKMRITDNGLIGVNNSNPSYQLDVSGITRISSNLLIGNSTDTSRAISALNSNMTSNNPNYICLGQTAATNNQAELGFGYYNNGSVSNNFTLGFFGGSRVLTVTANNTIGINNSNPLYNLDVTGTSRITGSLIQNNVYQWRYNFTSNSGNSPTNGGGIPWSFSNFTYSSYGNINTTNNLLTSTGVPTSAGFTVMMGPIVYMKHLISESRLPFTAAYFGSIGMTLFSAIGVSALHIPPHSNPVLSSFTACRNWTSK